jgi:hypothetical protein
MLGIFFSRIGEVMKFRKNKVKREHGIIQDALGWLEELSRCSEVTDIIPGVIQVSRSPERGIVYKYETQTGCKILLKSNGSIQEAFIVTKNPEFVRSWVENRFPPVSDKEQEQNLDSSKKVSTKQNPNSVKKQNPSIVNKTLISKTSENQNRSSYKPNNEKAKARKKGLDKSSKSEKRLEEKYLKLDTDSSNLGQRINAKTLQALRALQKDLNPASIRRKK